jgi:uncharacterized membrane protein (DUF2068 family)
VRGDRIETLIGAFKLAKAALLLAVAVGAVTAMHADVWHWVAAVRIDPNNRYVHRVLGLAADRHKLAELEVGTFLYAAVFAVEGYGLLRHRHWAEYLTIAVTTSFVPLEIYELVHRPTLARVVLLVANLAIVAYLVARVTLRHRRVTAAA